MDSRIKRAKMIDQFMTIVFYGIALFFFLLLVGFAGKVIIGGLLGAKPEMFGFTRSGSIGNQVFNTIYLVFISLLVSVPIGVLAGIYLAMYAKPGLVTRFLRTCIETLSSLPSIVVGLFGYLIFLVVIGLSKSLLAGALSISILSLPLITTTTEDAIKGLPEGYYHGSMGLGATKWQTIFHVLLPACLSRIMTGVILAAGRGFGEAAVLLYTTGSGSDLRWNNFSFTSPTSPINVLRPAETLSIQIWNLQTNGQDRAIIEISKSLWYLISVQRKKPYVIMLYGNSSLGKTELVREIAKHFFEGKVLEKHLSMFKNNNYSDYFFGEEPNRRSLGFDLLERTSNLIFLDELDKCPEFFYSAFYTLFDNVEFKDATYDVDISGTIIILTSNYLSEDEMKQHLGMPIFYRIDKMIKFEDFSPQTIYEITMKEIEARKEEYGDMISPERIYEIVSKEISTKNENARTIKFKVQQVIENLLFKEVENSLADKEKSLCPEEKT